MYGQERGWRGRRGGEKRLLFSGTGVALDHIRRISYGYGVGVLTVNY